jgi:hypothetical protein
VISDFHHEVDNIWALLVNYGGTYTLCNNPEEHRDNKAVHTMKAYRASTGITPLILNLGTGWMSSQLHALTTTLPIAKDQHTPPSQYPLNEN